VLRLIFCLGIIAIGTTASLYGPFYALLFYLWNAYFRPEDWSYGGFIGSLNLSWLIALYLVARTGISMPKYPFNWRVGLMALFVADSVLGVVLSEHQDWSWNAWLMFSKVALVAYLILVLVTDRQRYRQTLLVIAFSLGFEAAKQGWAQLFLNPGGLNNNTIAFLGDNNGVALGTMMLVPILGALAQTAGTRSEAWLHRLFLVGVLMRGLTTYSRGGFLAALVLGGVGLLRSPKKLRYGLAAAVLATLVTTVMPQSFWDRMSTVTASDENRDNSAAGRLHFWQVAVQMASAKPLTGVGFSGFNPSYESYNTSDEFTGQRAVHSAWFGVLADLGYPGLILFVTIWMGSLWSLWRTSVICKRDASKRDLRAYANALMSSLIVFAVAGTFLSVQYGEMFWHFVGLTMALVPLAQEETVRAVAPVSKQPLPSHPALARS